EVSSLNSSGTKTDQLWKSDGTTAGTQLLMDFPGPGIFGAATGFQNRFYFTIADPALNYSGILWVSDGRTTQEFDPGAFLSPVYFTPFNGQLYFIANNPSQTQAQLWKTDGT